MSRGKLPALALLVWLLVAAPAHAAFPGSTGQIAYTNAETSGGPTDVYTTGGGRLTTAAGNDQQPAWSPNGTKIAFTSDREGNNEIYTMNADGTGQTRLTATVANDQQPAWSPDGNKIVFVSNLPGNNELYTINPDGTGLTRLTNNPANDQEPAWSPDGTTIAFDSDDGVAFSRWIFKINANGSGRTKLTSAGVEGGPVWSPDGARIAFTRLGSDYDVWIMNANGSNETAIADAQNQSAGGVAWSPDGGALAFVIKDYLGVPGFNVVVTTPVVHGATPDVVAQSAAGPPDPASPPDWQPVVSNYARPQGATPLRVSLVPAFKSCASPNTSHQGPLSGSSCVPAVQASDWLTVGTSDANGEAAKSIGFVLLSVMVGDPSTPADEADLKITVSVKDVRQKANLGDYTGQLALLSSLRITDKRNGPSTFALPGTVVDGAFGVTLGCAATADTTVGSTCSVTTTADALLSNSLKEGKRAIWRFGQMRLFDGGADGVASTQPNTLFETDGVFVP